MANSKFREGKTSPTIEQLLRFYKRMPVLVYERVKTSEHLRVIKRYRNRLVFAGNLNVIGILLIGLTGYWYIMGTKYTSPVHQGLLAIMSTAKVDDNMYKVIDWFQKKGHFIMYVTKEH